MVSLYKYLSPKYLGYIVVVLCGAYIVTLYLDQDNARLSDTLYPSWIALLVSFICFFLSNLFATTAWRTVTDPTSNHLKSFKLACSIWTISNVSKYLPGNLFHYICRYRFSKLVGVSSTSTSLGLIAEVFTVSVAALILALPALVTGSFEQSIPGSVWNEANWFNTHVAVSLTILLVLILAICCYDRDIPAKIGRIVESSVQHFRHLGSKWVLSLLCCLCSFSLAGIAACAILYFNDSASVGLTFGPLTAAYAISFLLGYILPGAPGGLGVREVILVSLLSPLVGTMNAIALATTLRITSVAADLFSALVFSLVPISSVSSNDKIGV